MKKVLLTIGLIALLVTAASIVCFASGTVLPTANADTTVTMSTIFADDMVFQANEPINVFGFCETEGATIKVTLGRSTGEATVQDGKWSVSLPAMEYRKGLTLTVEEQGLASAKPIRFKNIAIGEVWVLSGQSNGYYEFYKLEDSIEHRNNADNFGDNIRVFTETKTILHTEKNLKYGEGEWHILTSDRLKYTGEHHNVSAVAYIAATKMAAEFGNDVPIAIINTVVSGSSLKAWLPPEVMQTKEPTEYANYLEQKAYFAQHGEFIPESSPHSKYASLIYEVDVKPYSGFTAKGVIWWQGESDCNNTNTEMYPGRFSVLRDAFRTVFSNEDMYFFVVQLHPYGTTNVNGVANFRNMQMSDEFASEEEKTYVIASGYEGMTLANMEFAHNTSDGGFVHNARKSPVGLRIANAILDKAYGYYTEDETAPAIVSIERRANGVIITFDSDICTMFDNELHGFEIAAANGTYYPAKAHVEGNVVTLTSEKVTVPAKVRYSYATVILVLKDGTEIEYTTSSSTFIKELPSSAGIIVQNTDGKQYKLAKDAYYSVRTRLKGNVTNASGIPLCAFEYTVN